MARVQHMGQSLPSTRRLMHLVNQSHPLSLRIGDTKSKSLLVTPYHTAMLSCEKPKATAAINLHNLDGLSPQLFPG